MQTATPPIIPHLINGALVPGNSDYYAAVTNPALGDEPTARVPLASTAAAEQAISAAKAAWPGWAATPPLERARLLQRFRLLVEQEVDALAALVTAEHGKTLSDARGSIGRGLEVVEFAAGAPHLLKGSFSANVTDGIDCHSLRQPLGVCVGITPFNFPAMVPLWMLPIALAAGNTFVLKPSEQVPSAPLRLAELLHQAGLPPGVLNVVQGNHTAAQHLITHPDVAAVSFVGSTAVAEAIHKTATAHGKRVQALAGAKNHLVVMPDAHLPSTLNAIMGAAFGSAGERCMAVSVVVLVGHCPDEWVGQLAERIGRLKVGPGTHPQTEMGPLISRAHLQRVTHLIASGCSEGADLVVDGRRLSAGSDAASAHSPNPGAPGGFFLGGSLFDRVTPQMRIYREEIFGPVLCLVRVPDLTAAIALINHHPMGNGTAIFTRSGAAARSFTQQVQVGMVGVNVALPVPMAFHTFGGWKNSLFGSHGVHGPDGFHFYTRQKTITTRWQEAADTGAYFAMPASTAGTPIIPP